MRRNILVVGAASLAAAFPACFAYLLAGWLGVGVLGLLIAFVGIRLELEKEGPVGHDQHASLYAESQQRRDGMPTSERAAARADIAVNVRGARIAALIGVVLIALGGAGLILS